MGKARGKARASVSIGPKDPRFALTAPKPLDDQRVADQDKFILRLPAGMRERIKREATRNRRSMNTEIIMALDPIYPPEPDLIDVMERVHDVLRQAQDAESMPYREELIRALDEFSERVSSGLEPDQYRPSRTTERQRLSLGERWGDRYRRWLRVKETGVEQGDLEREISRGMLRHLRGDSVRMALQFFAAGNPDRALKVYRLHEVKFKDRAAALRAIEADLKAFYIENWGDLDDVPPWEVDEYLNEGTEAPKK